MTCCVCQVRGGSEVCAVCDGESRLRLSRDVRAEERALVLLRVAAELRSDGNVYEGWRRELLHDLALKYEG